MKMAYVLMKQRNIFWSAVILACFALDGYWLYSSSRPEARIERKVNSLLNKIRDPNSSGGVREWLQELYYKVKLGNALPGLEKYLFREYVGDYDLREQVEGYGVKAIPALAKSLNPRIRLEVRKFSAEVLGSLGSRKAVPALEEALLKDPDAEVRGNAAYSLGQLEDQGSLPVMVKALKDDKSADVRARLAGLGGKFIEMGALPQMLTSMKEDPSPTVRSVAARNLFMGDDLDQKVFQALLDSLKNDPDAEVRAEVARALGWKRQLLLELENTEPFICILKEESSYEVRAALAKSLGESGNHAFVQPMISMLKDESEPTLRRAAAEALGSYPEDKDALAALLKAAKTDSSASVREEAVSSLEKFKCPETAECLISILKDDKEFQVRERAVRILGAWAEKSAPALLAFIESQKDKEYACPDKPSNGTPMFRKPPSRADIGSTEESRLCACAIEALVRMKGPGAAADLKRIFESASNKALRCAIIGSIKDIQSDDAYLMLSEAILKYPDITDDSAISALAKFKRPETLPLLHKIMKGDYTKKMKLEAMCEMAHLDKDAAIPYLKDFLNKRSISNDNTAIFDLLKELALPETEPFLTKTLLTAFDNPTGSNPQIHYASVRAGAAEALGAFRTDTAFKALATAFRKDRENQVRKATLLALCQFGPGKAKEFVIKALKNNDRYMREAALECIETLEDASLTPELMRVLNSDTDRGLRRKALELTAKLNSPEARHVLVMALEDGDLEIRREAAKILSKKCDADILPALLSVLVDNLDGTLRDTILDSLGNFNDPKAHDALLNALKDRREDVRREVASALAKTGRKEAVPVLMSLFKDDPSTRVRAASATALGSFSSPEVYDFLVESLNEKDLEVLGGVISGLGVAGNPASVPILLKMLEDEKNKNIRNAIIGALGLIGSPLAVEPLIAYAKNAPKEARYELCWTLGHLGDSRATDLLVESLGIKENSVAFAAGFALAEIRDQRAVPQLELMLAVGEPRYDDSVLAAACALAFMDKPQSIPALKYYLKAGESWKRFAAICSLLRLGTPEALKTLEMGKDESDRELRGLVEKILAGGGIASLKHTLQGPNSSYRYYTARMLMFFNAPEFLPILEQMELKDQDMNVREETRLAVRYLRKRAQSVDNDPNLQAQRSK